MAIEWNYESAMEFCLKLEIASVIKLILKKIKDTEEVDLGDILKLNIEGVDEIRQALKKLYGVLEKNFYPNGYRYNSNEEDEEGFFDEVVVESDLDNYMFDVSYCKEMRHLCGLNFDVKYFGEDDFKSIIEHKRDINIMSNRIVDIEDLMFYEIDSQDKRLVRMDFQGDIVNCIINMEEDKYKSALIELIANIYHIEWYAANILEDKIQVYGSYDLDDLYYNSSGSSEIYLAINTLFQIVVLIAVYEYLK